MGLVLTGSDLVSGWCRSCFIVGLMLLWRPLPAADQSLPYIQSDLQPQHPYVQEQVHYRLRLYRESHLQRGDFLLPEMADFIVVDAGEDDPVRVQRNGRELEMIEHRYLLFPQRSGRLQLPAPLFTGPDLFIRGQALTLQVRPAPVAAHGSWLPATAVRLSSHWERTVGSWHLGEPRVRILTLEADGLTASQLPPLPLPEIPGLGARRLSVELQERLVDGKIVGRRVERQVLVPRQAGDFALPALVIDWWQRESETPKQAVLAVETYRVSPVAALQQDAESTSNNSGNNLINNNKSRSSGDYAWVDYVLIATLMLMLVLSGWHMRPRREQIKLRLRQWRQIYRLRRAVRRGSPGVARDCILALAGTGWPQSPPRTLPEVAARLQHTGIHPAAVLLALDRSLYGGGGCQGWRDLKAWRPVIHYLRRGLGASPAKSGQAGILPPLDPCAR